MRDDGIQDQDSSSGYERGRGYLSLMEVEPKHGRRTSQDESKTRRGRKVSHAYTSAGRGKKVSVIL